MKTFTYIIVATAAFGLGSGLRYFAVGHPESSMRKATTHELKKVVTPNQEIVLELSRLNPVYIDISLPGDRQARRALAANTFYQFSKLLEEDPTSSIKWLSNNADRLPMALRRKLAAEAAKYQPELLLEGSFAVKGADVFLDLLNAATKSNKLSPLDQARFKEIQEKSTSKFPSSKRYVEDMLIANVAKGGSAGLIDILSNVADETITQKAGQAAVALIAKTDLVGALELIKAKGIIFEPSRLGVILASAKPEDFDNILAFLEVHQDPGSVVRMAAKVGAQNWPEDVKLKLFEWSMGQNEVTRQIVTTELLQNLDSVDAASARGFMDGLLFDRRVEYTVAEIMARKGEVNEWVGWIAAKGGLSQTGAMIAEETLARCRPQELAKWKANNPGKAFHSVLLSQQQSAN